MKTMSKRPVTTNRENFLKGFSMTMDASTTKAEAMWDYYCEAMSLSPAEIEREEAGGFQAGMDMACEMQEYLR